MNTLFQTFKQSEKITVDSFKTKRGRVKDSLLIIILHARGDHYVSLISLQLISGI